MYVRLGEMKAILSPLSQYSIDLWTSENGPELFLANLIFEKLEIFRFLTACI